MALSIDLSVAIQTDRQTFVLTDNTVFGGSNPARASMRVYIKAFKVDFQNTKTDLGFVNTNPTSASTFSIPYTIDGHYQIQYVALSQYNIGTTYAKYDAVWNGSSVYRSLVNSNTGQDTSNTSYWELITSPASLAANKGETNESLNLDSIVYDRVFAANGQWAYGNWISDACSCTDCDTSEQLQTYDIFSLWLREAEVADQRGEVVDGEVICRRIEAKYIDCLN